VSGVGELLTLAANLSRHGVAIDEEQTRDLAPEVLDDEGRIRVLPASYWAGTTPHERALFGHRHGIYSFPTVELVEYLRDLIGDREAIEIGAGHGVLAQALGIPATDSRQQAQGYARAIYEATGRPPVQYGPNVEEMHASRAVRHYRPQVVVGCWVTHLFDPRRPEAGGNNAGIDEWDILRNCGQYVVVGNDAVHGVKAIWSRPHHVEHPPWLYSRAVAGGGDFVAVWRGVSRVQVGRRPR